MGKKKNAALSRIVRKKERKRGKYRD